MRFRPWPLLLAAAVTACSEQGPGAISAPVLSVASAHASCALSGSAADISAAIDALIAEVNALEASGSLSSGQANALRNHLENARRQLDGGRLCAALAQLRAFREQVQNFVADGVLTEEEATPLLEGIDGLITFNVALGKPVTATGTYGVLFPGDAWQATSLPPAPPASITDGSFLTEQSVWHQGTVWWDGFVPVSSANVIEIDLGGAFVVSRLVGQTDNNDTYPIQYRDQGGTWNLAWTVPAIPGFGMMTRQRTFVTPIVATALRLTGAGGDAYFSASEVQAWGYEAP